MPTQLTLLGEGLLASLVVCLQLIAWVALGSRPAARVRDDEMFVSVALLAGAAITSFLYALLTWSGHVTTAIVVVAVVSLAALALGGRAAAADLGDLLRELRRLAVNRLAAAGLAVVGVSAWLLAISPPRDADVMRYHLAHIRQIVLDGRWDAIPDYHYALPFGWSLNFLPFERFGLPVGANLLSLGLTLVTLAVLVRVGREVGGTPAIVLAAGLVLVFQPSALKAATTAHADAYAMLVTATLAALLLRLARGATVASSAIGFVAFVGFQSRYQAAAVAIAGTAAAAWIAWRRRTGRELIGYASGAGAALVLAAPFYLRNWLAFDDPFWPIGAGDRTYADRVVSTYEYGINGHHTLATYTLALRTLLSDTLLFPVPIVLVLVLGALLVPPVRRRVPGLAVFVVGFVVIWASVQPRLYSRFTLIVAPAAALVLAALAGILFRRLPAAAVSLVIALALVPFAAFDVYYSADTARLLARGDLAAYHRYTWYYPVYSWVNDHTPPDARGLVFAQSGLSYYLDRPYRRADPTLSGVVDWKRVRTAGELRRVLRSGSYDFVIYDNAPWPAYASGANLTAAIRAGRATGLLRPVKSFDLRLYLSRVRRTSISTHVTVFAVEGARRRFHG